MSKTGSRERTNEQGGGQRATWWRDGETVLAVGDDERKAFAKRAFSLVPGPSTAHRPGNAAGCPRLAECSIPAALPKFPDINSTYRNL